MLTRYTGFYESGTIKSIIDAEEYLNVKDRRHGTVFILVQMVPISPYRTAIEVRNELDLHAVARWVPDRANTCGGSLDTVSYWVEESLVKPPLVSGSTRK